jgi:hypothetical protein
MYAEYMSGANASCKLYVEQPRLVGDDVAPPLLDAFDAPARAMPEVPDDVAPPLPRGRAALPPPFPTSPECSTSFPPHPHRINVIHAQIQSRLPAFLMRRA